MKFLVHAVANLKRTRTYLLTFLLCLLLIWCFFL